MILFLSHLRDRTVVCFTEEETNTQGSRSWPKFQLTRAEGRSQARLTPKPNLFPLRNVNQILGINLKSGKIFWGFLHIGFAKKFFHILSLLILYYWSL